MRYNNLKFHILYENKIHHLNHIIKILRAMMTAKKKGKNTPTHYYFDIVRGYPCRYNGKSITMIESCII